MLFEPMDFRTKSELQCTEECGNPDSFSTVPDGDPLPRGTWTKVRVACLPLSEELPLKEAEGVRNPPPELLGNQEPRAGAQVVSNGRT